MTFSRRNIVFGVLGILLVANLVIFFTYRVQQQQRIDVLRDSRTQLEQQLEAARAEQSLVREQIASVGRLEQELDRIFNDTWGRPDERLTPLLRELYRHASESGLQPTSRNYGTEQASQTGEATSMTISFGVEGTYRQLRRMIDLVETSDQYVVIDSLGLGASTAGSSALAITMQLRTLFREEPRETGGAARTSGRSS